MKEKEIQEAMEEAPFVDENFKEVKKAEVELEVIEEEKDNTEKDKFKFVPPVTRHQSMALNNSHMVESVLNLARPDDQRIYTDQDGIEEQKNNDFRYRGESEYQPKRDLETESNYMVFG